MPLTPLPPSYEGSAAPVMEPDANLLVSAEVATTERREARIVERDREIAELKRRLTTEWTLPAASRKP